ncbi:MAG: PilZ domain-containing protein [Candidatus Aureabacteria bacterium]|nr:PilZ domain-containing protein [Candidatus Auribacterota bacterium]
MNYELVQQMLFFGGMVLFAVSMVLFLGHFFSTERQYGKPEIRTSRTPSRERRRYIRITAGTAVRYHIIPKKKNPVFCSVSYIRREGGRIISEGGVYRKGFAENISASGVLFKVKELLPGDAFIHLVIESPSKEYSLEINGKIVRVEKNPNLDFYEVAVAFLNPSPEEESKLSKFVSDYFC